MPTLQPVDVSFVEAATHHVHVQYILNATTSEVWAVLADHGSWDAWYPGMSRCDTSEPGGLGAVRTVRLGPLVAKERWVLWEPERALGFTVIHTNLPTAKHILEQIHLEAVSTGSRPRTRVRFTGSYRPSPITRLTFSRTTRRIEASWTAGLECLADHIGSQRPTNDPTGAAS